ncbi:hypothetical protein scyTo_0015656 [Scyliorhinus torazame]|uniref:Uncharacterized protein n=1 Tax=Scyliorhinus torazame TaxID=75743 RepID=A0A401PW89_SCYTO|nr:hypothetical protein [Scyliorhinus torazame]
MYRGKPVFVKCRQESVSPSFGLKQQPVNETGSVKQDRIDSCSALQGQAGEEGHLVHRISSIQRVSTHHPSCHQFLDDICLKQLDSFWQQITAFIHKPPPRSFRAGCVHFTGSVPTLFQLETNAANNH